MFGLGFGARDLQRVAIDILILTGDESISFYGVYGHSVYRRRQLNILDSPPGAKVIHLEELVSGAAEGSAGVVGAEADLGHFTGVLPVLHGCFVLTLSLFLSCFHVGH